MFKLVSDWVSLWQLFNYIEKLSFQKFSIYWSTTQTFLMSIQKSRKTYIYSSVQLQHTTNFKCNLAKIDFRFRRIYEKREKERKTEGEKRKRNGDSIFLLLSPFHSFKVKIKVSSERLQFFGLTLFWRVKGFILCTQANLT